MLEQIKLNNSSYKEIFQKALGLIPVLSDEWTDYNYSDPGITTLQVLSIIKLFQQSYVDKINDNVKQKLLKLLGYGIEDVKSSVANLSFRSSSDFELFSGLKVRAGDVVFETQKNNNITDCALKKIVFYNNFSDEYVDVTTLLNGQTETVTYLFDKDSGVNSKLYLVFDKKLEKDKSYNIYVEVDSFQTQKNNNIKRNSKDSSQDNIFEENFNIGKLSWQCLTENGWKEIEVQDRTVGFLQSGMISFRLDDELSFQKIEDVGEGCFLRVVLRKNGYDFSPCLKNVYLNSVDVVQKDTKAKSFVFDSDGKEEQEYIIKDFISVYDNVVVLVKEESDKENDEENDRETGEKSEQKTERYISRYFECKSYDYNYNCDIDNNHNGVLKVRFSKSKFGFAPPKQKNAVKIICYTNDFFNKNLKTRIYGFENQIIKLDNLDGIISSDFKAMIKAKRFDGEEFFCEIDNCFESSGNDQKTLYQSDCGYKKVVEFEIDSNKKELKISRVNISAELELIVTDCALSKGKNGNLRKNEINKIDEEILDIISKSDSENSLSKICCVENLCQSKGGKDRETVEDVVVKAMKDFSTTHSLVTRKDFETRIFQIPGVNIHKVKAICNSDNNNVSVYIKPSSQEKFPVLSDSYKNWILKYLNKYRLITTQIDVFSPVYVPISVSGHIYIKPNFKDAEKIIKNLIEQELDGINSDKDFGHEIIYGDLYSKIENLNCVEEIYSLTLKSSSKYAVELMNSNIVLGQGALSYMGDYNIEISNNIMMVV